jgi:hypothetical protein
MRAISRRPNSARRKKAPTNALSFCEIAYYSAPATRIMRHVRYWPILLQNSLLRCQRAIIESEKLALRALAHP